MTMKAFGAMTAVAWVLTAVQAQAQSYPTRAVTFVVTAAAGGVTDTVARALGQRLSEKWGQQIVVENKGGGAHIVGAQQVANAPPDGHTVMLAEAGTFVINPHLYPKEKMPVDIERDFVLITGLVRIHHSVMVAPNMPVNSVAELVALARQKPGEITYGTAGVGSGPHVNVVRFENAAKVKLNAVHYRGATPAQNDVMGGHTSMMMVSVSLALPAHRDGKLKMLSIGSAKRLPQLLEFPTTAEAGNIPGYIAGTWFGLAVTAGTPRPIVDKINADVRAILRDPAFAEKNVTSRSLNVVASTPQQFAGRIRDEVGTVAEMIRAADVKPE